MSFTGARGLLLTLVLTTACGGRVVIDGAEGLAGSAGGGGGAQAVGGAGSGAADGGALTVGAGGVARGGGGTAGASAGADSGITLECPPFDSDSSAFSALDGKGCTDVGANCKGYDCIVRCQCVATGASPRWGCVTLPNVCGGPPK